SPPAAPTTWTPSTARSSRLSAEDPAVSAAPHRPQEAAMTQPDDYEVDPTQEPARTPHPDPAVDPEQDPALGPAREGAVDPAQDPEVTHAREGALDPEQDTAEEQTEAEHEPVQDQDLAEAAETSEDEYARPADDAPGEQSIDDALETDRVAAEGADSRN